MAMQVAAIVLAAGASRRLGRPKQLLEIAGESLLARVVRLAAEAGAEPVIAVLGANCEIVRAAIASPNAICIVNENWGQGIASSIRAGLDALESHAADAAGALLLTCDQPRLTAPHLRSLLDRFAEQEGRPAVASRYASALGVPAVFPRNLFAGLRELRGDRGARSLLANPPCPLIEIEFPGGEIDIDTPADLTNLGLT
ncbi:MAG TPA: nucleotidyltransferase family protein [Terracidiphilus sp.]|nr:nucleotidyltransferase family protein [Terracidiphilus sp.]